MAPRTRSLATRLVMIGVIQLALISITAIAIFIVEGPHDEARPEDHVDLRKLENLTSDTAGLTAELDALREQRIEISLYDGKRELIATNVDPPLAIPARFPRFDGRDRNRDKDRDKDRAPKPDDAPPPGEGSADGRPPTMDPPRMEGPRGPSPFQPRLGPNRDKTLLVPFHPMGDREQRGVLVARGVVQSRPAWIGPVATVVSGLLILVIGAWFTARWIVRPIDRLTGTVRDLGRGKLDARSRLERTDEIGELGHRFDEMADRIQDLMRSEKELFANIAHELRTPLTRIGVALDLATEGDASAARASLEEIAVDVSELETIVDDILSTLRFEIAGREGGVAQLPLRRAHVEGNAIASAAAERLRSRHANRNFEAVIPDTLPNVDADQVLVRRVLDNLLENAHKYSPNPDAKITLTARADKTNVIYEVADHGIGISAEDLPRVFTAFFRSEKSRTRAGNAGGVGLGLTLAKRIVDAHDGTIDVTSVLGQGTKVVVTIPIAS